MDALFMLIRMAPVPLQVKYSLGILYYELLSII